MADQPDIPDVPPGAYRERRAGDERRDDDRRGEERRREDRRKQERRGTGNPIDWDGIERRQAERRRIEDIIERGWPLPGEDGA